MLSIKYCKTGWSNKNKTGAYQYRVQNFLHPKKKKAYNELLAFH